MVDFYGFYAGKSASPMDGMGKASPTFTPPQVIQEFDIQTVFVVWWGGSRFGYLPAGIAGKNRTYLEKLLNMGVSKNRGTPKSSILIGFSLIFTIHFGVFPYFRKHPYS